MEILQQIQLQSKTIPVSDVELERLAFSYFPAYISIQHPSYEFVNYHRVIAKHLMKVESGEILRLAIFAPPRHGKTSLASEYFPAWYLGRNPSNQIIATTYSFERAGDTGRKIRNQLIDPIFSKIFPDCKISSDNKGANRVSTLQGGNCFSIGVGGAIIGRGADLLLIDDPVKSREDADSTVSKRKLEQWFDSVAYTRLMPNGAIVLIMTRWAFDDLSGYLIEEKAHENWVVLSFPAIAEEDDDIAGRQRGEALWHDKYPIPTLEKIKKTSGTREWNALYQQKPISEESSIVNLDWFQRYGYHDWATFRAVVRTGAPVEELTKFQFQFRQIVCSWDSAFKEKELNDPSACTIWGVTDIAYYLIWAISKKLNYPDLKREVIRIWKSNCDFYRFHPSKVIVLIEDSASGQSLIQELKNSAETIQIPVIGCKDKNKSKIMRFSDVSSVIESGKVFFPVKAPWLVDVETQIMRFPHDRHDDYVDTISQFLKWVGRRKYTPGRNLKFWK